MLPYRHVIVADFEFEFGGHDSFEEASRSGERPRPVCLVAKDLNSGQEWRIFRGKFGPAPPFPIGPDALFIAYYASAELGCFKALGWQNPANILDLFCEFRLRTNKTRARGTPPAPAGLVDGILWPGWSRGDREGRHAGARSARATLVRQ
jgi:DNA polymerase I